MIDPTAEIHPTAVIYPGVSIGARARIGAYSVIGGPPEHKAYFDGKLPTYGVEIYEDARVFEFVTVHAGISRPTTIGPEAAVFNHSHIGHDCFLSPRSIVGGHSTLGGHVCLMHHAHISGRSCVRHRVIVGAFGFLGGNSFLTAHLPPGELWNGSPARPCGINTVGMERANLSHDEVRSGLGPIFQKLTEESPL